MDTMELASLFEATYHHDVQVRKQAEQRLGQLEGNPHLLTAIMHLLKANNVPLATQQAAAIYFKNRVRRYWDISSDRENNANIEQQISNEDQAFLKREILSLLVHAPNAIQVQLTSSLNCVLATDFPEKWPEFIHQVVQLIQSANSQAVYTGLISLLEVIKVYRFRSLKRRGPLTEIVEVVFPQLQKVAEAHLESTDPLAIPIIKTIFKSYALAIQAELPTSLQNNESLVGWGTLFIKLVERPIPLDESLDEDEQAQLSVWKSKKWAYHCINKLFSRYGNPSLLPTKQNQYQAFAKTFILHFIPQIFQAYIGQTTLYVSKQAWMSPKIRYFTAAFFSDCVKDKNSWKLLKPHLDMIISQFIFGQLCFSKEDQELWEDNPVDYINKKMDPLDDFRSPVLAASNLLIDLAVDRKKTTLMPILAFVNNILTSYNQAAPEARDPYYKDGALNIMATLAAPLSSKRSPIADSLEEFLATHVVPEFSSTYGFLRCRALDAFGRYASREFTNKDLLVTATNRILERLHDPEIPVRVQAALARQPLIGDETVREALAPRLPQIMKIFLDLTNQIDSDALTQAIEDFVETFSDRMAPFAVELATQLCDSFMRIIGEVATNTPDLDSADFDDLSDKTMAAMGVLKTIGTLILNLDNSPEIVLQLEKIVFPVIRFCLDQKLVDMYDEVFEILDCCTFTLKKISPHMWELFDPIYLTFKDSGTDFAEEILPSLDNYISYGSDVVTSHTEVQTKLYDIIEFIMKSDRAGESDRICACKLAEALMLHCPGKIDQLIPGLLNLAATYILSEGAIKTRAFRVYALEVVLNALYYNAPATLAILAQNNWVNGIFTAIVQNLQHFSRVHDKKLLVVALTAVLQVPPDQLPAELQSGLPQIVDTLLQVFQTLPKAVEARENLAKIYEADTHEDFDADFDWGNVENDDDEDEDGEEDGDVRDPEEEYFNNLIHEAQGAAPDEDDEGDDYEIDDEELDEELAFESPLDKIDPYVYFEGVVKSIQNGNPAVYNVVTQNLTPEKQTLFIQISKKAEEARAKATSS